MLRLYRLLLWGLLAASAAGMVLSVRHMMADPAWAPLVNATSEEIRATTDRALASVATPEAVRARIAAALEETPRNWLVLDALRDLAVERHLTLGQDLNARFDSLRAADHGYLARARSCAVCAWDASSCRLSQVLLCQAPIALTPLGDIAGILRAGVDLASGAEIDRVDLALSVIGIGATAAILVSGGGSATVKAAAGFAKLARKMGRLSARLEGLAADAIRSGIDLARLPAVRSVDDLRAVVRAKAFEPLTATLADLNRVRMATDTTTALYLMKWIDTPEEARRLAATSEALGGKLVGRAEMLGKARLLRAATRLSGAAWTVLGSFAALVSSLAALCGHWAHLLLVQWLKRGIRRRKAMG